MSHLQAPLESQPTFARLRNSSYLTVSQKKYRMKRNINVIRTKVRLIHKNRENNLLYVIYFIWWGAWKKKQCQFIMYVQGVFLPGPPLKE